MNPYLDALNKWALELWPILLTALSAVIVYAITTLTTALKKRIDLEAERLLQVKHIQAAETAVRAVEQIAGNLSPTPSLETQLGKKEAAVNALMKLAPAVKEENAPTLIEAAVNRMRGEEKKNGVGVQSDQPVCQEGKIKC